MRKSMTYHEKCPISGKTMRPVFSEIILGKYYVTYYYCEKSGLLKTEAPYWLDEAYQEVIADTDTALVMRNILASRFLERILYRLFKGEGKFLDVSGGYGILTRLLRDVGFDCYTTDKYCKNLFAKGFEPGDGFQAKALFAFEVLEHLEDPLSFLEQIFEKYNCRTLVFSTLTFTDGIPSRDWPYFSFETGQHITFYQPHTLALLAEKLKSRYYMINPNMHMFTDTELSKVSQLILFQKHLRKIYALYVRWKRRKLSKNQDDQFFLREELRKKSMTEATANQFPIGLP